MKDYEIGKVLKKGLNKKGVEQIELAGKLGLEPSTVSRWVTGKSIPDANTFLNAAECLDINVNGLMKTKREESQDQRLLQLYDLVRDEEDREAIIKVVQIIVNRFDK